MNQFNILTENTYSEASTDKSLPTNERIKKMLSSSDIFVFMKGNADFPQCGFSANTIGILKHLGVQFKTFDILSDQEIRQGVKDFANWPTYPQVWFKGELIGGNDIVTEMVNSGELQQVFGLK